MIWELCVEYICFINWFKWFFIVYVFFGIVCLLGVNGVGKSFLLEVLVGFMLVMEGEVLWGG